MAANGTGTQGQPTFLETGAPEIGTDDTLVSNYAALVGNRKRGTSAQRIALAPPYVWEGMAWKDSDATKAEWVYQGGAWVRAIDVLDSGWLTATLNTGWAHQSGETLQYRIKNGFVTFRGRIVPNASPAVTSFTLPAGFVPAGYANNLFIGERGAAVAPARVNILSTGAVNLSGFVAADIISLAPVTFLAA